MSDVPPAHPSLEQLRSFSQGQRPKGSDATAIEAHLETCADCLHALEAVSGDSLESMVRSAREVDVTAELPRGSLNLTDGPSLLGPPQAGDELGRLGDYRVLKVLGQGGMGVVYEAEDVPLQRRVALKVMRPEVAAKPASKERFLLEARLAARIEHDNVATIHRVGEERGVLFLAMPLLKGMPLAEMIERSGKLSVAQTVRLGRQVALGLAAAHEKGLIHRDIKPANLWLEPTDGGRVKILDFGLARAADDIHLTQTGTILGTPAYMAPEQARGEHVDGRSDLFSLGVVLYRLSTGELPFRGENTSAVLLSLALDTPVPPLQRRPDLPAELSEVILKLLAKNPAERYQSALEVAEALTRVGARLTQGEPETVEAPAQVLSPAGGEETQALPAQPANPAGSRRRRWPAVVAAVALLLLLPLGYFFGPVVIRYTTNKGVLVVEVDDPNVEVIVKDGILLRDIKGKREFEVKAGEGEGEVEVFEKDGVKVATRKFTLVRGGRETVVVRLEDARAAKRAPAKDKEPIQNKEPVVVADPDRKAALWVLSIGRGVIVTVKDQDRDIRKVEDLPREPFSLLSVHLAEHPGVSDAGLANFAGCKNLKFLNLARVKVTNTGLAHLKDCKNLQHLNLGGTQVDDVGLALFKDCKNLTFLDLGGTQVDDVGLAHFKDCKNLQHLNLGGTKVSNAGLANFKGCKNLMYLSLSHTPVTDAGLAHFKDCKNLTFLDLELTTVGDTGLAHVADCKNLQHLILGRTRVTDTGLTHFKDCKNLQHLNLFGTKVSNAGLANFKGCNNLDGLTLSYTQVDDAGLEHFRDCKSLRILYGSDTNVSDASLAHLGSFLRLSELDLNNTRVSKAGHNQLKAALPGIRISWSEKNRNAAEAVFALGGTVHARATARGEDKFIQAAADLPDTAFRVSRVKLVPGEKPLKELITALSQLYDPDLDSLAEIDLTGSSFNNGDLARLASLQNRVTRLSLSGTQVKDEGLINLKDWTKLQRLDLDGLALNGSIVPQWKSLTELTELRLGCKTLNDLFADQIGELKTLKKLEKLSLAGSTIGDGTLERLHTFPALKELDLTDTKATPAGVAALKKALPACQVVGP